MLKMTVHISQEFETEAEALEMYEEIRGEVRAHDKLHLNCQVIKKFTGYSPENPNGHPVNA